MLPLMLPRSERPEEESAFTECVASSTCGVSESPSFKAVLKCLRVWQGSTANFPIQACWESSDVNFGQNSSFPDISYNVLRRVCRYTRTASASSRESRRSFYRVLWICSEISIILIQTLIGKKVEFHLVGTSRRRTVRSCTCSLCPVFRWKMINHHCLTQTADISIWAIYKKQSQALCKSKWRNDNKMCLKTLVNHNLVIDRKIR